MLTFYLSLIADEAGQSKFEQLYLQHRHTMLWVANSILHDHALAEDAVHDAFLRIISHLEKIQIENCNKTRAFFVIIVRNIALDYIRKRSRQGELPLDDFDDFIQDGAGDPEETYMNAEDGNRLRDALDKIKESYADALSLQVFYELSDKEIARILNITPANVRVRLTRARKQIRQILQEGDPDGPES